MAPRPCSLCLAYAFLLCTGLFGGHLFYVERYAQAVVWMNSWGVFGVGLLYDLFNLPRYVAEANGEAGHSRRGLSGPGKQAVRMLLQFVLSLIAVSIAAGAMAVDDAADGVLWGLALRVATICVATTVVTLVGNIGSEQVSWKPVAVGVAVGAAVAWLANRDLIAQPDWDAGEGDVEESLRWLPVLCGVIAARVWRADRGGKKEFFSSWNICLRWGVIISLSSLGVAVLLSSFLRGAKFTCNGQPGSSFVDCLRHADFGSIVTTRVSEHAAALELLGVDDGASLDEIRVAYKRAARQWHPDKNLDDPETANEMFVKIQRAYDVLTNPDTPPSKEFGDYAFSGFRFTSEYSDHHRETRWTRASGTFEQRTKYRSSGADSAQQQQQEQQEQQRQQRQQQGSPGRQWRQADAENAGRRRRNTEPDEVDL